MENLVEFTAFITIAYELKSSEVAAMLHAGMAYKDFALLMVVALFAMAGADQFTLLRGQSEKSSAKAASVPAAIEEKPFRQLFIFHFFSGFIQKRSSLQGAGQIGYLKFFIYNLFALGSWLILLLVSGSALRALWVEWFGPFGPLEVELITAVMVVYGLLASTALFLKK